MAAHHVAAVAARPYCDRSVYGQRDDAARGEELGPQGHRDRNERALLRACSGAASSGGSSPMSDALESLVAGLAALLPPCPRCYGEAKLMSSIHATWEPCPTCRGLPVPGRVDPLT